MSLQVPYLNEEIDYKKMSFKYETAYHCFQGGFSRIVMSKVYVGNVSFEYDPRELEDAFAKVRYMRSDLW